jgi:excisionase family DNA binding protein
MMEKLTMTIEEAGAALGLSRATAYKLAHDGTLPTIRLGRQLKVPKIQLERMMEVNNGRETTEIR